MRYTVARGLDTIVVERGSEYRPALYSPRTNPLRPGWWEAAVEEVAADPVGLAWRLHLDELVTWSRYGRGVD